MSFEPGAQVGDDEIPLAVPEIRGNEWAYVEKCLTSGWVSSVGAYVNRFEEMVAARAGAPHGVATVNGTAALHVALLLAGVEAGDEVVVPSLTFIAPANAVRYAGAWPVFVDVEPEHWQMDAAKLAVFLRERCERRGGALWNRETGRRVRAIVPVHVLGHPVDLDPVLALAKEYGLAVIEDATESLGATYRGRPVGALGDAGCFSFNGNKLITTGGGGMIVTAREAWAQRARFLTTQAKDDAVEYIHSEVGFNYRLTNVQAAIGVAQMEQLDAYIARKREIARTYVEAFADADGIEPMREAAWAESVWWLFTVRIDEARFGMDSRALLRALQAENIQTRPLWQPLHLSAAHSGAWAEPCPVAERLNLECLSLPCSVGLTDAQQARVIDAVLRAAGLARAR